MNDEESVNKAPISDDFKQRISPYDLLMRQSRKMGGLATRTYDVTKEFLKQDVSVFHPDRILFGGRGTKPQAQPDYTRDTQQSEQNQGDDKKAEPGTSNARAAQGIREAEERDTRTLDAREGLRKIVKKSHQLLASFQTVILPMNLFPDSVTVDRTKVTITKRSFFWTSSVISIRIEDVLNVACSTGPIFGSLIVSSRVMNSTDHYEIDYFWRKDALYLKQLIQGYVIAQHNQIETSHLKRDELIKTLLDLGNDSDY